MKIPSTFSSAVLGYLVFTAPAVALVGALAGCGAGSAGASTATAPAKTAGAPDRFELTPDAIAKSELGVETAGKQAMRISVSVRDPRSR